MTRNNNYPRTISDMWPELWLKPDHFKGTARVQVRQVDMVEVYNRREQKTNVVPALVFQVVTSKGEVRIMDKRLIINKTQALAMQTITGSEIFADWSLTWVRLAIGTAPNGKATIIISQAPAPEQVKVDEDPARDDAGYKAAQEERTEGMDADQFDAAIAQDDLEVQAMLTDTDEVGNRV